MDLEQLLTAILNFGDMDALRKALKERAKVQIYQHFFNEGHGVATAEAGTQKEQLEARLTAAEQAKQTAEKALKDWKEANPDTARIHEQYTTQIADIQTKHKTELEQREQRDNEREVARSVKTLTSYLIDKGVHPVHAKALVKDETITKRIQPHNGTVRVLQKDKDIAFAESDPEKAIELLADELKEGVEPDFIVSRVPRGSGRGTTTGDASTRGNGDAKLFEEIQQDVARKFGRDEGESEISDAAPTHRRRRGGNAKDALNQRMGLRSR